MNIFGKLLANGTGLNPAVMTVRATLQTPTGPMLDEVSVQSDGTFELALRDPSTGPVLEDDAHLDREVLIAVVGGTGGAPRVGPSVLTLREIAALTKRASFYLLAPGGAVAVGVARAGATSVVAKGMVLRAHWNAPMGSLLGESPLASEGRFVLPLDLSKSGAGLSMDPQAEIRFSLWDGGTRIALEKEVYELGDLVRILMLTAGDENPSAAPRVHGRLATAGGEPLAGYEIRVAAVGFKTESVIARAKSDTTGAFSIPFTQTSDRGTDLRVAAVTTGDGKDLEVAQSGPHYGVRGDLEVTLTASEADFGGGKPQDQTEWQWVDGTLSGQVGGSTGGIEPKDITYLAHATGIPEDLVTLWFRCRGYGGKDGGGGGGGQEPAPNPPDGWTARYAAWAVGGLDANGQPVQAANGPISLWKGLGPTSADLLQETMGDRPAFFATTASEPQVIFGNTASMHSDVVLPRGANNRTLVLIGRDWANTGNQAFLRYGDATTAGAGFIIGTLGNATAGWRDANVGVSGASEEAFGEGPLGSETRVLAASYKNAGSGEVHLRASYTLGADSMRSHDLATGVGALVVGGSGAGFSVFEILAYAREFTQNDWDQTLSYARRYGLNYVFEGEGSGTGGGSETEDPAFSPEVQWGLFRQGLPDDLRLASFPQEKIATALTAAVVAHQIASGAYSSAADVYDAIKARQASEIVSRVESNAPVDPEKQTVASVALDKVADILTATDKRKAFVGHLFEAKPLELFDTDDWNALATAIGVTADDVLINKMKRRVDLSSLGMGSVPLARAVETAYPTSKQTRASLAGFKAADWATITDGMNSADLPVGVDGSRMTSQELAKYLARQLSAEYPAESLAGRTDTRTAAVLTAVGAAGKTFRDEPIDFADYVTAPGPTSDPDNSILIEDVKSYQALSRLVDDADVVVLLAKAGYKSAADIDRASPAKIAEDLKGAATTAEGAPSAAEAAEIETLAPYIKKQSRHLSLQVALVASLGTKEKAAGGTSESIDRVPNWKNLFGSPDSCECDQCLSAFSPAAYLVDTLEYLDEATRGGGQDALFLRRPDLPHLNLTCENTYTEVPYIDLANEILEYQVVHSGSPLSGESIDTVGDRDARRRKPQSLHLPAYAELAATMVPWRLPFDLPRAVAQESLSAAGVSYGAALEGVLLDYPWTRLTDPVAAGSAVLRYACERLGLLPNEVTALGSPTTPTGTSVAVTWGDGVLDSSVRQFLDRSGLSYDDLIELLATNFVGRYSPHVALYSKSPCDLDSQELVGLTLPIREGIHRFCRLRAHLGTSIHETDLLLTSLGFLPTANALFVISPRQLCVLATALDIKEAFDAPWDEVAALWADLDAKGAGEPRRLYDLLFEDIADQLNGSLDDAIAPIAERLGADRDELRAMFQGYCTLLALDTSHLTLATSYRKGTLSLLQRLAWLKAKMGVSVEEFLALAKLFHTADPSGDLLSVMTPDRVLQAFVLVQQARSLGLPLLDLLALVVGSVTHAPYLAADDIIRARGLLTASTVLNPPLPDGSPTETTLASIYRYLEREQLPAAAATLRQVMELPTRQLTSAETPGAEALVDRFFQQIGMVRPTDVVLPPIDGWQDYFPPLLPWSLIARLRVRAVRSVATSIFGLDEGTVTDLVAGPALINLPLPSFVNGLTSDTTEDQDVALAALDRMAYLSRTLGWREAEFKGYSAVATTAQLPQPRYLPSSTAGFESALRFGAALALDRQARGALAAMGAPFSLSDIATVMTSTAATLGALDDTFLSGVADHLERWLRLYRLVGIGRALGSDTWNASLRNVIDGSGPTVAARSVGAFALLAQATVALRAAGDAAKGIAIVDRLRERRRDALLACVMHKEGVKTSDELFGRLLVDVETQSCMTTSRIRLAMSSVQLFVDRVALGLESPLALDPELRDQWTRRRRYRLWEAQQKAFVFPENYLRPELRDDKSSFFEDFEDEVSSNNLNAERIEAAVGNYVHQLRALAAPDVRAVGEQTICTDPRQPSTPDRRAVHVVARTSSNPHEYYHRIRYQNDEGAGADEGWWTPWSPLPTGMNGENFVLVDRGTRGVRLVWSELSDPTTSGYNYSGWTTGGTTTATGTMMVTRLGLHWMDFRRGNWATPKSASDKSNLVLAYWPDLRSYHSATDSQALDRFGPTSLFHLTAESVNDKGDVAVTCYTPSTRPLNFNGTTNYCWARTGAAVLPIANDDQRVGYFSDFTIPSYDDEVDRSLQIAPSSAPNAAIVPLPLPGDLKNFHLAFNRVVLLRPTEISLFFGDYDLGGWGLGFGAKDFDVIGTYAGPVTDPSALVLARRDEAVFLRRMRRTGGLGQWWASPFHHPGIETIREVFTDGGVDQLYFAPPGMAGTKVQSSLRSNSMFISPYTSGRFEGTLHGSDVHDDHVAHTDVDYDFDSTQGPYNWELFYHLPMLLADRLRTEQQFDLARRWLEAIFDPFLKKTEFPETLTVGDGEGPDRVWRFRQFAKNAEDGDLKGKTTPLRSIDLERIQWDPFSPHKVARTLRPDAFARAAVLRYIELFVEWADSQFREDTLESINEATQRYLVARMLLGERPRQLPSTVWRAQLNGTAIPPEETHTLLSDQLVPTFSLVDELADDGAGAFRHVAQPVKSGKAAASALKNGTIAELPKLRSAFCVPPNPRLIALWDVIEDRLFKIRSCRNIDGAKRDLPLFEPEALDEWERRAAVLGTTVAEAIRDVGEFPAQRFLPLVQRALEFAQEVKGLGAQLLQTVEKRDGEQLGRIRATHETAMGSAILATRREQRTEAQRQLEGLRESRTAIEQRHSFYAGVERVSSDEQASIDQGKAANELTLRSQAMSFIASELSLIPESGTPPQYGGLHLGHAATAMSSVFNGLASYQSWLSTMSSTNAGHQRRWDDWKLQERVSAAELRSMDRQILAAEIRLAIAEREVSNQETQLEFAREAEEFLATKFTNTELYSWMLEQVRGLYGEAWRLAVEMARRAERAYRYERCLDDATVSISDRKWDNLREGLLAPERLIGELRRMEASWINTNQREFELVEHFSLASIAPVQLAKLRLTGNCTVDLPEELFDLQCPGHYFRRVRTVAMTIPGVVGPNTSVHCKLSLLKSAVRVSQSVAGGLGDIFTTNDARFLQRTTAVPVTATVTSTASRDTGVVEGQDDRYLPFEGAGAVSQWKLEILNSETPTFDLGTMTDAILHMTYTAREGTSAFAGVVRSSVQNHTYAGGFFVSAQFPDAWEAFKQASSSAAKLPLVLDASTLPWCPATKHPRISRVCVVPVLRPPSSSAPTPLALTVPRITDPVTPVAGLNADSRDFSFDGAVMPGDTYQLEFTSPSASFGSYFEDLWISYEVKRQ